MSLTTNLDDKFKAVFENVNDAIFILSGDKYAECNIQAEKLLGYSKQQLAGIRIDQISPLYQADGRLSAVAAKVYLKEALKGIKQKFQWLHLDSSGNEINTEVSLSSFNYEGKTLIIAVIRDESEKQQKDKLLIEQQEIYRSLIQSSPFPIYVLDNKKYLLVNKAWEELFGYSFEEVTAPDFDLFSLIAPESHEFIKSRYNNFNINSNNNASEYLFTGLTKNKRKIYINATVTKVRYQNRDVFQGLYKDITREKLAEESLFNSRQMLNFIFDNIPQRIFLKDENNVYFRANKSFLNDIGLETEEELIGLTDKDLPWKDQADEILREDDIVFSGKSLFVRRFTFTRREEKVIIRLTKVPLRNISGNIVGLLGTYEDITDIIKYNDALQESELKYRELIDNAADAVIISDDNGIVKLVNNKCCEITGYKRDELLAQHISKIQHFDSTNSIFDQVGYVGNYIPFMFDGYLTKKDASVISVEVSFKRIKENWNQAIIRDITEKKKAYTLLTESEEKYSSIFNNHHSPMIIVDPESGIIVDLNAAAAKFYGYSINDLKGKDIEVINPDRLSDVKVLLDKADVFFQKHKRSDSSIVDVEIHSGPIFIDGRKYVISIIHDISQRIIAEESLLKTSSVVEQSPIGILIANVNGNIEYANKVFYKNYNISQSEILDKPLISFYADLFGENQTLQDLTKGNLWSGEFLINNPHKGPYWANITITTIKNNSDEIINFALREEDINEKKLMVQELENAKNEAEEMNRLKSMFFANMSHELRTPLVGILGYSQMLTEELNDSPLKTMSDSIHKGGNRLLQTLNLILDLTRIEANKMEINFSDCNLTEIVEEVGVNFSAAARIKNLYLNVVLDEQQLIISIDERHLTNILNNLINNAIKFTEQGGVTVTLKKENNNAVIKVEDTGIGIAPEKQAIVFEAFRQASEGISRNFEGTGLGLTLTKKFVEIMNGTIDLESSVSGGTCFTVKFPLVAKEEINYMNNNVIESEPRIITRTKKILIVEDEPLNLEITKTFILKDYLIDTASNGEEALRKIKSEVFHLILMDINLGSGLSGLEIMKILKEEKIATGIPVIALTAYALKHNIDDFLANGFVQVLTKPFTKKMLLYTIDKYIV